MNKTKIEWATMTWNPVTGCLHGCDYCFAKGIAHRFCGKLYPNKVYATANCNLRLRCAQGMGGYILHEIDKPVHSEKGMVVPFPFGFAPTIHRYRLSEPAAIRRPQNVFVVDMGDLFGEWVPDSWIREVFAACEAAPWNNYMFLTKATNRYNELFQKGMLPTEKNYWFGTTVTNRDGDVYDRRMPFNTFASIEPLMEDLGKGNTDGFPRWIIIGAETGNRKGKVVPQREWIASIVEQCREAGVPIFLKNNLQDIWGEPLIQELPEGLRAVAERAK